MPTFLSPRVKHSDCPQGSTCGSESAGICRDASRLKMPIQRIQRTILRRYDWSFLRIKECPTAHLLKRKYTVDPYYYSDGLHPTSDGLQPMTFTCLLDCRKASLSAGSRLFFLPEVIFTPSGRGLVWILPCASSNQFDRLAPRPSGLRQVWTKETARTFPQVFRPDTAFWAPPVSFGSTALCQVLQVPMNLGHRAVSRNSPCLILPYTSSRASSEG